MRLVVRLDAHLGSCECQVDYASRQRVPSIVIPVVVDERWSHLLVHLRRAAPDGGNLVLKLSFLPLSCAVIRLSFCVLPWFTLANLPRPDTTLWGDVSLPCNAKRVLLSTDMSEKTSDKSNARRQSARDTLARIQLLPTHAESRQVPVAASALARFSYGQEAQWIDQRELHPMRTQVLKTLWQNKSHRCPEAVMSVARGLRCPIFWLNGSVRGVSSDL